MEYIDITFDDSIECRAIRLSKACSMEFIGFDKETIVLFDGHFSDLPVEFARYEYIVNNWRTLYGRDVRVRDHSHRSYTILSKDLVEIIKRTKRDDKISRVLG